MTTDHGRTSNRVTLPIGQIYHVAVDNDEPDRIHGKMQDNGTMRGTGGQGNTAWARLGHQLRQRSYPL
jgi:hypothetical protein